MAEVDQELQERFAAPGSSLDADLLRELHSIMRVHSISVQELFYKWESYSIKMGSEDTKLDVKTARDLKKDLHEALERDARGKAQLRSTEKRGLAATPRHAKMNGDLFGSMDGIVPQTPGTPLSGVNGNAMKRKGDFKTPGSKASKTHLHSSPNEAKSSPVVKSTPGGPEVPFSQRADAGKVEQTLNSNLATSTPPAAPYAEPRIKLKAVTDMSKFSYKPMAMKLSEASEILDDRIDEFLALVQEHFQLDDGAFGNPASQSTSEVVAVGRIASDTSEAKLNSNSIVLETSRRTGAGLRVPLRLASVPYYALFPGKIIAVKGTNPTGEFFVVSEMLELPLLPLPETQLAELNASHKKMAGGDESAESDPSTLSPLNVLVSSGPYTADSNLDFEPLHALVDRAIDTGADCMILLGPFLDIEHPLIAAGNFALSETSGIDPDTATLTDMFRILIAQPLQRLVQAIPTITILLMPSVRDIVNKHVSWPQDRMVRKELGLPKQCSIIPNPATVYINELVVSMSTQDILYELRREECTGGSLPTESQDLFTRLSRHMIEQRHFFPLYPATNRANLPRPAPPFDNAPPGDAKDPSEPPAAPAKALGAMLELPYLKLGEWLNVRPDILITPSALAPFGRVVESVLVVNPGPLSKRRGAGTFAQMYIGPRVLADESSAAEGVSNAVYARTRLDVTRI